MEAKELTSRIRIPVDDLLEEIFESAQIFGLEPDEAYVTAISVVSFLDEKQQELYQKQPDTIRINEKPGGRPILRRVK